MHLCWNNFLNIYCFWNCFFLELKFFFRIKVFFSFVTLIGRGVVVVDIRITNIPYSNINFRNHRYATSGGWVDIVIRQFRWRF